MPAPGNACGGGPAAPPACGEDAAARRAVRPGARGRPSDLRDGAVRCAGPALAVLVFAVAMGSIAQAKGWSLAYALLFCLAIVGASVQVVALQMWDPARDFVGLLAACLAVHSRYILICASIAPLLAGLPLWRQLVGLHFTTDSNWAVTMGRLRHGEAASAAFLLGGGLLVVACYAGGNVLGFLLASRIPDLRTLGLDFAIPGVFLCLLVGLWKSGRQDALPWLVAGAAALAVKSTLAGAWYVLIGGAVGSATALLLGLRRQRRTADGRG